MNVLLFRTGIDDGQAEAVDSGECRYPFRGKLLYETLLHFLCRSAGISDGQDILRLYACDIHEIAGSRYDDRSFSASRHSKEQRCSIHAPDSGFLLFVESANIEFLAKSVVIQCSAPPNFYIYIIPHISLIVNSFQKS